jgi:hypothetical protein
MASPSQPAQLTALADGRRQSWHEQLTAPVCAHSDLFAGALVVLGFCWRLWLAHATFFNTDEAWHYSVANQNSLLAVYKASLTLAHPPLMVLVLYFWRHLGTSDLVPRLPGVLAGTIFCWVFYKWLTVLLGRTVAWCGLIFAAFLPPMIAISAELRQYSWMLMFAVAAAYFLEQAPARNLDRNLLQDLNQNLVQNSARAMLLSSVCLWLAMLSHYSAFLFAASLGIYAILRMIEHRPTRAVMACWAAGQGVGVGLAAFLYFTHIAHLGAVYPGEPLHRFADFYLSDWYFHPGRDNLLRFLWRGTLGVFRFTFGQMAMGQIAAILFFVGIFLLIRGNGRSGNPPRARLNAVLLTIPFILNWIVVVAGLYPYGRTRQCIFLAIFGLAGVSVALSRIVGNHLGRAIALSVAIVVICQAFGTLQGRDMLPLADQRREHMDQALQLIHSEISPADVIFTDKATSFQLAHYLCGQKTVSAESLSNGLAMFQCDALRIVSTGSNDGALTADGVAARWRDGTLSGGPISAGPISANHIWIVQAGWASGLGEQLRRQSPSFAELEIHSFGRFIEVLKLPPPEPPPAPASPR